MKKFRCIINYWRKFIFKILFIYVLQSLQIVILIYIPKVTAKIVDEGINGGDFKIVLKHILTLACIEVILSCINYRLSIRRYELSYKCEKELKLAFMQFFVRNTQKYSNSAVETIIGRDLNCFVNFTLSNISGLIISTIKIIIYAVVIFRINIFLALITMALATVITLYNLHNYFLRKKNSVKIHDMHVHVASFFHCLIHNIKELYWIGASDYSTKKFEETLDDQFITLKNTYEMGLKSATFVRIHSVLTDCCFWGVGGAYVILGQMTLGILMSYMGYCRYILTELSNVLGIYGDYASNRQSVNVVVDLLGEVEPYYKYKNNNSIKPYVSTLRLEKFSFSYGSNSKGIFDNVDMTFYSDKINYIVGKNGIGKSTLLKCISGEFVNYEGEIWYDNMNIKELIETDRLNEYVSWIPQEPIIFPDSILNNLTLCSKVDFSKVECLCKMCGLENDIKQMEHGYNTYIGDNGIGLSGGQKQKIGLIRALIQDKPILFIDEVTAGIDIESKSSIKEGLQQIENKMIFFVTHDTDSIVSKSRIFALNNRKIIPDKE